MNGVIKLLDVTLHCFYWWQLYYFASFSSSRVDLQFFATSNTLTWRVIHESITRISLKCISFIVNTITTNILYTAQKYNKIKGGEKWKEVFYLLEGRERERDVVSKIRIQLRQLPAESLLFPSSSDSFLQLLGESLSFPWTWIKRRKEETGLFIPIRCYRCRDSWDEFVLSRSRLICSESPDELYVGHTFKIGSLW